MVPEGVGLGDIQRITAEQVLHACEAVWDASPQAAAAPVPDTARNRPLIEALDSATAADCPAQLT